MSERVDNKATNFPYIAINFDRLSD